MTARPSIKADGTAIRRARIEQRHKSNQAKHNCLHGETHYAKHGLRSQRG